LANRHALLASLGKFGPDFRDPGRQRIAAILAGVKQARRRQPLRRRPKEDLGIDRPGLGFLPILKSSSQRDHFLSIAPDGDRSAQLLKGCKILVK
jgi:hypothetical protein